MQRQYNLVESRVEAAARTRRAAHNARRKETVWFLEGTNTHLRYYSDVSILLDLDCTDTTSASSVFPWVPSLLVPHSQDD